MKLLYLVELNIVCYQTIHTLYSAHCIDISMYLENSLTSYLKCVCLGMGVVMVYLFMFVCESDYGNSFMPMTADSLTDRLAYCHST